MNDFNLSEPIRLIAIDMDGTLLNDDMEIVKGNVEAIQNAMDAGIQVMIATGRSMNVARRYIEQLGLNGPQITVNGGEVWDSPDQLIKRTNLETDDVAQLQMLADKHDVWFWIYGSEGVFNKDKRPPKQTNQTWLKYGYYSTKADVLKEIWDELRAWGTFSLTNSSEDNIEVNPYGVNKGTAIQLVCERLNIPLSAVAALGDSLNDFAMIETVGFGIAMGNAQDTLKKAAKWVTKSNLEAGVAFAIKRILEAQR